MKYLKREIMKGITLFFIEKENETHIIESLFEFISWFGLQLFDNVLFRLCNL